MASQNSTAGFGVRPDARSPWWPRPAVAACRFIAYDGSCTDVAGGAKDTQGVTEHAAEVGDAVVAITGYSALVEAEAAIAFGALVKVGTDGKAITGTTNRPLRPRPGRRHRTGQLIEVQLYKHVRA